MRQQGRDFSELPLSRRARILWDGLGAKQAEDVGFEATGHIKLARSESRHGGARSLCPRRAEYGLDLQLLGANALRAEMPWLGPAFIGASLSPTDGQANPRVVGPLSPASPAGLGAEVREHAPVRHAHDGPGSRSRPKG